MFLLVAAAIFGLLFIIGFLSKRRFGTLGLGLTAGYLLWQLWKSQLLITVSQAKLPEIGIVSWMTVFGLLLILLPSLFLTLSGSVNHSKINRIISSVVYAVLAIILCAEALLFSFSLTGQVRAIYDIIDANKIYIITVGIILAILDNLGLVKASTAKKA